MRSCKNTKSKGHVTLWVEALQGKSPCCHVWWPKTLWKWRHNGFSLSRDIAAKPRGLRVEKLYGLWVKAHQGKSPSYHVWWPKTLW